MLIMKKQLEKQKKEEKYQIKKELKRFERRKTSRDWEYGTFSL